ncbi:5914_t:CDS:2 [Rhizophagus irregularis]|nr:5914_t:CDS:2 [Rhizophagus irregularis]
MDNEEVFYDESDKENDENDENNECDEFIRSWLEILVEDTNNGINNISVNALKYWNTKTGTHVSGSNIPVNANPACT